MLTPLRINWQGDYKGRIRTSRSYRYKTAGIWPKLVVILLFLVTGNSLAQSVDECETRMGDSVDFHAHGFNIRHLPIEGILLSNGVPRGLSLALAL